jgi:hypothetical protein
VRGKTVAYPVVAYCGARETVSRDGPERAAPWPVPYRAFPDRREVQIAAVDAVRGKGLKVDLVMIEGKQHGKALEMKADADLTFDSFWLGMQGSGLEAASMGQMVVAGDASVKALYEESDVGMCPYTFAGDRKQLTEVIERAIVEPTWHASEAKRVGAYVTKYHDYAAVARRYEGIIAQATGWENVATSTKRGKRGAA